MKRTALAAAAAFVSYGFGDPAYFANKKGTDLFARGEYKAAMESYSAARALDPGSKEIDFNLGQALFKLGNYGESAVSFGRAAGSKDPALKKNATSGQAAALYKAGDQALTTGRYGAAVESLEKSVEKFKSAVMADPSGMDIKKGLELAMAKLEEAKKKADNNQSPREKDGGGKDKKDDTQNKDDGSGEKQRREDQSKNAETKNKNAGRPENKDDGKKDHESGDSGKDGKQNAGGMTEDQANQVLSAVAQDEKNLRNKIRNKVIKETPRQGKDW